MHHILDFAHTITYADDHATDEEDGHLFAQDDTDKKRELARACEDVRLDLAGHDYLKSESEVLGGSPSAPALEQMDSLRAPRVNGLESDVVLGDF